MSMGLLLVGGFCAFLMHPETPFEADEGDGAGRAACRRGMTEEARLSPPATLVNQRNECSICRSIDRVASV